MKYEAKNYDHLLGTAGFSDNSLKTHFALYQGYVANTNKLLDSFQSMVKSGTTSAPEFSELKRRFGWEFGGMRLHEYYFGSLKNGGSAFDPNSGLALQMKEDFGSYDSWLAEFKATALSRGIGWSILYYDHLERRLLNPWVNEQDQGHLIGAVPLLNIDMFEHAFIIDYGLKKADYFEAFMKAIDWEVVSKRFQ